MAKTKVSATLSPERIRRAREVAGTTNLSELLERGLDALIERELERRWLEGYDDVRPGADLPDEVPPDLTSVPWEDET